MMEIVIFILCAVVAVVSAVLVVTQRNPIASVMFLVTTFVAQAVLFIQLTAAFLAMLQIIVYAGAIMVLFLFVIMLLNLRKEDFGKDINLRWKPLAVTFAVVLLVETAVMIQASLIPDNQRVTLSDMFGSVEEVAKLLFTEYLYPFELASVLLLVAILGAVVMAKKRF